MSTGIETMEIAGTKMATMPWGGGYRCDVVTADGKRGDGVGPTRSAAYMAALKNLAPVAQESRYHADGDGT